MRVLVCGDRNWTNWDAISRELAALKDITCVIDGGAPGAGREISRLRRRQARLVLKHAKCARCGSTENLTLDHVRALSAGGTDAWANLQALCATCNVFKDRNPPDFEPKPFADRTKRPLVPIVAWSDQQLVVLINTLIYRKQKTRDRWKWQNIEARLMNLLDELVKRFKPEWGG